MQQRVVNLKNATVKVNIIKLNSFKAVSTVLSAESCAFDAAFIPECRSALCTCKTTIMISSGSKQSEGNQIKRSKTSSAIQNVVVLIKTFGHAYLLCIVVADLECTNEFHWMPNVKSSPCRTGGCVFR